MGGSYPDPGHSWNFWGSNPALAAHVINTWNIQTPLVFLGDEIGKDVLSGAALVAEGPHTDPVRKAYMYYSLMEARCSWDPLAVLYAARGNGNMFEFGNEYGRNKVFDNGSNQWIWDENVTNQHFLRLRVSNETAARELDRLYLAGAQSALIPAEGLEGSLSGGSSIVAISVVIEMVAKAMGVLFKK